MTVDGPAEAAAAAAMTIRPADRLPLAIGRVVQADVSLEWQLRILYQALCGPSLAATVVPVEFGRVHSACKTMIEMAGLPAPWDDAAMAVLQDTEALHGRRNRLVHDRFFLNADDQETEGAEPRLSAHRIRANALRMTVSHHELAELESLPDEMHRVVYRLNALCFSLPNVATYLGPGRRPGWNEDEELRWVRGEFEMADDGGARLLDT